MTDPINSGWRKIAGWDSCPLRNAAFARRTPNPEVQRLSLNVWKAAKVGIERQLSGWHFCHQMIFEANKP